MSKERERPKMETNTTYMMSGKGGGNGRFGCVLCSWTVTAKVKSSRSNLDVSEGSN